MTYYALAFLVALATFAINIAFDIFDIQEVKKLKKRIKELEEKNK